MEGINRQIQDNISNRAMHKEELDRWTDIYPEKIKEEIKSEVVEKNDHFEVDHIEIKVEVDEENIQKEHVEEGVQEIDNIEIKTEIDDEHFLEELDKEDASMIEISHLDEFLSRKQSEQQDVMDDMVSEVKILQCPNCFMIFDSHDAFALHFCPAEEKNLQCPNCFILFDSQDAFDFHDCQAIVKKLQCPKCLLVFDSQDTFALHDCKSEVTILQCPNCSLVFENMDRFELHDCVLSDQVCFMCNIHFPSKLLLLSHRCAMMKGTTVYTCGLCEKVFKKKHVLKRHMLVHSNEKPFACTICGWKFQLKHQLKSHMNVHSDDRPFKCEICSSAFKSKKNMWKHVLIHNGENVNQRECKVCKALLASQYNLDRHMKTHTGLNMYTCGVCDLAFNEPYKLRHHLKLGHLRVRKTIEFECSACEYKFKSKTKLVLHMKNQHGQDFVDEPVMPPKTIQCQLCTPKRKFNSIRHIKRHVEKVHKGATLESVLDEDDRPGFSCHHCNKQFFSKPGLDYHCKHSHKHEIKHETVSSFREHEDDDTTTVPGAVVKSKPKQSSKRSKFECEECWDEFDTLKSLKTHMNSHDNKYTCCICKNGYPTQPSLQTHMHMEHEHVRNFRCLVCNKYYRSSMTYIKHLNENTKCQAINTTSAAYTEAIAQESTNHIGRNTKRRGTPSETANQTGRKNTCSICNKSFTLERLYMKHLQLHNK